MSRKYAILHILEVTNVGDEDTELVPWSNSGAGQKSEFWNDLLLAVFNIAQKFQKD